ncbi:DUF6508 domain-containing protein [Ralstonia syzygii subsp. celebesensis]|uniref:Uncharacterized protein n=3 Tax=Ralstonia solanacearum species complex TaxID=3116862 RepID=A0AAD0SDV7_RALSL|nr:MULTISPECIES: DUF6508 domain-containing protein [Ralstonia solanacearum species complex]CCA83577.1 conserved hypothethical protein [blood disease bacterium R229]AQW32561.1 hypothetical protein B0B51_22415 [blood disease bacterium A2-HR MARDI]AXV84610.1 hypothetical protein CJO77_24480 [Ralstonia solanacearum]AXW55736.1 hypothetical protein CJO92_24495 [Ralstonia solanacearum]QQV58070.1 hypothetical protein JK151_22145 [Ralstonia syzygii subsp. celebesensis]
MALPTISREAVSKVLDLAPHIDAVTAMAGPVGPHPDLRTIIDTLDETGFITPFDWPAEFRDRMDDLTNDDLLRAADLETLRKVLTAQIRLNRFNEGYLDEVVRQGKWATIISRLRWLYDNDRV